MSRFPRVRPVGDQAATLELGDAIDAEVNRRVQGLDRALAANPFPGFREAVPTYRSLLVVYDRNRIDFGGVSEALLRLEPLPEDPSCARPVIVVPTCYGGDHGPDLDSVAAQLDLRPAELIERHTAGEYIAYMLGFLPGFAYLGLLPKELETPRRASPRPRVPAGSIGIAARQTGVYPTTCPGGWNLIGRTSVRLFTVGSDPPALILPGDRVRFTAVKKLPSLATAPAPLPPASAVIEVLEPGLLTTVQDVGRFGQRRLGVGWTGAADAAALAAANQAVGNAAGAAALECTLTGPSLRFLGSVRFAIAGADLNPVLERPDLGLWPVPAGASVLGRAGNVLRFTERRSGCRAYVAFAGGLDVPLVMGSRATDLAAGLGGFGGRGLAAGDLLGVGLRVGEPAVAPSAAATSEARVRVVLGPQDDFFSRATIERFLDATWQVAPTSDRIGCRLTGPPVKPEAQTEIVSDGMLPGSIQVPPNGEPIVMLADAPTTGGYPKIATVVAADLRKLAQLVPGAGAIRFETIEP